jgi:hypothetical protein
MFTRKRSSSPHSRGTGFSREGCVAIATNTSDALASSRLKPVPRVLGKPGSNICMQGLRWRDPVGDSMFAR